MFPEAALFATVALPGRMPESLEGVAVNTSWMQRLPGLQKYYRLYFLLIRWQSVPGSLRL